MQPYQWTSGEAYQNYVGRWSRKVAAEFLTWLSAPPGGRWLDVGCGTGALTGTILERCAPARVTGVDSSGAFIEFARSALTDPRVDFVVSGIESWEPAAEAYEAAVSGLALNFFPDAERAAAKMAKAVRRGGLAGVYVWDYAERMDAMRYFWDAAYALDPAAKAFDEAVRFPICDPDALRSLFLGARLQNVTNHHIVITTKFADFDDYWTPFLGGPGPAPGYAMSLTEDRRSALRDLIRSRLPVAGDGTITLSARAWAVQGRKG